MTPALQRSVVDQGAIGLSHSGSGGMPPDPHKEYNERKDTRGQAPSVGGSRGVPQTFLGREGEKNGVYVAARTPTPPIVHDVP